MPASDPTDRARYRAEVWSAVGALWGGFGDKPDELVTPFVPAAPDYIDKMCSDGATPQATALEIVVFIVRIHIENGMTPAERQECLAELMKVQRMGLEEAEGYRALPLVAHTVAAWQTAKAWEEAGKVDADARTLVLTEVVRALIDKPPQRWSALAQLERSGRGGMPDPN